MEYFEIGRGAALSAHSSAHAPAVQLWVHKKPTKFKGYLRHSCDCFLAHRAPNFSGLFCETFHPFFAAFFVTEFPKGEQWVGILNRSIVRWMTHFIKTHHQHLNRLRKFHLTLTIMAFTPFLSRTLSATHPVLPRRVSAPRGILR